MGRSLKLGTFIPVKLLPWNLFTYIPIASCSLRNFDFLLLHTENFDKAIILPF